LSISGDTHLGGEDFDRRIIDYMLKLYQKKTVHNTPTVTRALSSFQANRV
jgi:heat shock protein 5